MKSLLVKDDVLYECLMKRSAIVKAQSIATFYITFSIKILVVKVRLLQCLKSLYRNIPGECHNTTRQKKGRKSNDRASVGLPQKQVVFLTISSSSAPPATNHNMFTFRNHAMCVAWSSIYPASSFAWCVLIMSLAARKSIRTLSKQKEAYRRNWLLANL